MKLPASKFITETLISLQSFINLISLRSYFIICAIASKMLSLVLRKEHKITAFRPEKYELSEKIRVTINLVI
jgi:hypothetical protein